MQRFHFFYDYRQISGKGAGRDMKEYQFIDEYGSFELKGAENDMGL